MKESPEAAFYLYTPMCGTCAVASKMMEVITVMRPEIPIGKADLNYVQDIAIDYEIESVPCLLITKGWRCNRIKYMHFSQFRIYLKK